MLPSARLRVVRRAGARDVGAVPSLPHRGAAGAAHLLVTFFSGAGNTGPPFPMTAVVAWLLLGLAQVLRQDDPSELCEYYRNNHTTEPVPPGLSCP
jgi:hypothetical protein